jgi:DNA polymerase III alpha subunit
MEMRNVFGSGMCGDIAGFDGRKVGRMLRSFGAHTFGEIRDVYALSQVKSEAGCSYIGRKVCGEEGWESAHPLLGKVVGETLGHFIYEEQVFLFLRLAAGFTRREATEGMRVILRKCEGMDSGLGERFVVGCLANDEFRVGIFEDEKAAKDAAVLLREQLKRERWATRMKAHCVGQVELAMRLAYLKVHYAKEWEDAKERQRKKIEDERVRREDDFLSECE